MKQKPNREKELTNSLYLDLVGFLFWSIHSLSVGLGSCWVPLLAHTNFYPHKSSSTCRPLEFVIQTNSIVDLLVIVVDLIMILCKLLQYNPPYHPVVVLIKILSIIILITIMIHLAAFFFPSPTSNLKPPEDKKCTV